MSHWIQPPDGNELQELALETSPRAARNQRWYAAAFAIGVVLVCALGFATDIFDSGPTDGDVSAAFRDGLDRGTLAAETYWQEELNDRWWDAYKVGKSEGTSVAPVIEEAVRDGFSWDNGFEAGLKSPDIDLDSSYRLGWMDGYTQGWRAVIGDDAPASLVPGTPEPDSSSRVQWVEWGGEP